MKLLKFEDKIMTYNLNLKFVAKLLTLLIRQIIMLLNFDNKIIQFVDKIVILIKL